MEAPVETIREDGYLIKIFSDPDPQDPREWDNVGVMVCEHRRYNLGDHKDHKGRDAAIDAVLASRDYRPSMMGDRYDLANDPPALWGALQQCSDIISMPLYLYDHSGITMSTSKFSCPWDSGQIGFIFCTNDKALEEWGSKGLPPQQRMSPRVRQKAIDYMTGEVETYDQFIRGDVYGFVVERDDGEELSSGEIDSCWGYHGIEAAKEAAMEVVNGDKEARGSSSAEDQEAPAAPVVVGHSGGKGG
jgi:hypothetical protein